MTAVPLPFDRGTTRGRPPKHLEAPERLMWVKLIAEYGLADAPARLLLEQLCCALAVARKSREVLDREGIVTGGKPHPLTRTLTDAQKTVLATLKALALDIEPLQPRAGRPVSR